MQGRNQTKIIATLGPATEEKDQIAALFQAGARIFRLNFSHNDLQWHRQRIELIRSLSQHYQEHFTILADLQGPKIRLGCFKGEKVYLQVGQRFSLQKNCPLGDAHHVGLDCPEILNNLKAGDILLFDDGKFSLEIERVSEDSASGIIKNSGWLASKKGINKRGGGLSAPAFTEKDHRDLKFAAEMGVDYLGLSFVRSAQDIHHVRSLLREHHSSARIVAKIECAEAVNDLNVMRDIIQASDLIMIARGDLGVEIGDAALAMTQKRLMRESHQLGVPVITATQLMESMVHSPVPTRAEVLDLSNAIVDGTAALMLSAETTVGQYPIETVKKVSEVAQGVEQAFFLQKRPECFIPPALLLEANGFHSNSDTAVLLKAAAFSAQSDSEIAAIFAFTASAQTILALSTFCRNLPIFAISPSESALRQSQMCSGVRALFFPCFSSDVFSDPSVEKIERFVLKFALERAFIALNQKVLLLHGSALFEGGGSNTLRILKL